MAKLVRKVGSTVAVASTFVHGPGYQADVASYSAGGTPPAGWVYFEDDVTAADFAPVWVQPTTVKNAYALGAIVDHNSGRWRSLVANNVWEPGVSGWADLTGSVPVWHQPTGAHDAYAKDTVVSYNGEFWSSLIDANVWAPGVSGWRKAALLAPDGTVSIPAWVQPTGAQDSYALGAKVTHNGQTWTSQYANNVWEPGVFGWVAE